MEPSSYHQLFKHILKHRSLCWSIITIQFDLMTPHMITPPLFFFGVDRSPASYNPVGIFLSSGLPSSFLSELCPIGLQTSNIHHREISGHVGYSTSGFFGWDG